MRGKSPPPCNKPPRDLRRSSSQWPITTACAFFQSAIENLKSKIAMGRTLENLEQFGIDVVLGRRRGFRAAILRGILYALSFVYERIVQFRLYLYRKRIFRERTLGCLVISIGNLTVGG